MTSSTARQQLAHSSNLFTQITQPPACFTATLDCSYKEMPAYRWRIHRRLRCHPHGHLTAASKAHSQPQELPNAKPEHSVPETDARTPPILHACLCSASHKMYPLTAM